MPVYDPTPLSKVRRMPERASYDSAVIYPIIDAAWICHVAFVSDGQPVSIPILHARVGDTILLHGSAGSRLIRHLQADGEICASFALVDGLVLAKSIFHHSVNYRSAVVFGRGRKVEGEEELLQGMRAFTEKLLPGRWDEVRPPNHAELRTTGMAVVEISAASAKSRNGPPGDDPEDASLPVWNGVLPLRQAPGTPSSTSELPLPASLEDLLRRLQE